jgi:hypothetical protein
MTEISKREINSTSSRDSIAISIILNVRIILDVNISPVIVLDKSIVLDIRIILNVNIRTRTILHDIIIVSDIGIVDVHILFNAFRRVKRPFEFLFGLT